MPIYEYVCTRCSEPLEKLQKLSDDPLTDCPACGESALRRKVSAAGFRLAGSGWYETDFKSSNQRNLAGKEGRGSSGESSATGSNNQAKADSGSQSSAGANEG